MIVRENVTHFMTFSLTIMRTRRPESGRWPLTITKGCP